MKEIINRKDRKGIQLREGDIVAESTVGEIIWDGKAKIEMRPLGFVTVYHQNDESSLEENDFYNIEPLRVGRVKLLDEKNTEGLDNRYTDIHIRRYDGVFYAWDNIERIGSVYDLRD